MNYLAKSCEELTLIHLWRIKSENRSNMMNGFSKLYNRVVLGHPKVVLIVLLLILAFFSYHAKDFKLDASPDTLLLEDDKDLKKYREISDRYKVTDFLFVTFTPYKDLFSKESLQHLKELREALRSFEKLDSVVTILDIPLLRTSGIELSKFTPDNINGIRNKFTNFIFVVYDFFYANFLTCDGIRT